MALAIPKATYGASWLQVFRGDSDGCRRMEPLYTLTGAPTQGIGGPRVGVRFVWQWRAAMINAPVHVHVGLRNYPGEGGREAIVYWPREGIRDQYQVQAYGNRMLRLS